MTRVLITGGAGFIGDLASWLDGRGAADRVELAHEQLAERGLRI